MGTTLYIFRDGSQISISLSYFGWSDPDATLNEGEGFILVLPENMTEDFNWSIYGAEFTEPVEVQIKGEISWQRKLRIR